VSGQPGRPGTATAGGWAAEVTVERATMRTRDGIALVADVYLPERRAGDAALPTILERTPYDRTRLDLYLMGRYFASRGYAVVIQDCRGRFESGGVFSFHSAPLEHLDGFDTVEWIAEQPWSDGRVGTTGFSYGGANQQALAVAGPDALATQIILDAGYNYWARMIRQAGAFSRGIHFPYALWMAMTGHEAAVEPEVRTALAAAIEDVDSWIRRPTLRRGETPLSLAPTYEAWYFDAAERADYDEGWRGPLSSLEANVDSYPDIPVCLVTSWYGHHALGNARKFEALTERLASPVKLVAGVWQHGIEFMQSSTAGEVEFGNSAAIGLNDFRLRWFERHLKGAAEAEDTGPAVEFFVMGGGSGRRTGEGRMAHGGRWAVADRWPPDGVVEDGPLHLHGDGSLRLEEVVEEDSASTYTFDPDDPVPTIGGGFQDPLGGERAVMHGGGFDQRGRPGLPFCRDDLPIGSRDDVLVFRTAPLAEAVEVVGSVTVRLWCATGGLDTDFTAKLIDECPPNPDYPAGFALNLTDAIVRLRYRNGATEALEVTPHQPYELEIELPPVANLFAAGHRLRLDVSSSNAPLFDVNPNTGEDPSFARGGTPVRNTVFHQRGRPSSLTVPVSPHGKPLKGALRP